MLFLKEEEACLKQEDTKQNRRDTTWLLAHSIDLIRLSFISMMKVDLGLYGLKL